MNNKFDELTKSMAQSVTRRAAMKKLGVGLAGMALACFAGMALSCFGLANKAVATTGGCKPKGARCHASSECCSGSCPPVLDKGGHHSVCL